MVQSDVTWGVFSTKEIIQPAIVDPASSSLERCSVWDLVGQETRLATLYTEADPSKNLLEEVNKKSFFLTSFSFVIGLLYD